MINHQTKLQLKKLCLPHMFWKLFLSIELLFWTQALKWTDNFVASYLNITLTFWKKHVDEKLFLLNQQQQKMDVLNIFLLNFVIFTHRYLRKIDWALAHTACPGCRKKLCQWLLKTLWCHILCKAKIKTKTFPRHSHLISLNIDTSESYLLSDF